MRGPALACLLLAAPVAIVPGAARAETNAQDSIATAAVEYRRQCSLARASPDTVDHPALRRAFLEQWGTYGALSPGGIYQQTTTIQRRFAQAKQANDIKAADRALDELLEIDCGNQAVHLLAMGFFEGSGRGHIAHRHQDMRQKILDAILASGDGKTAESAYPVIGISEAHLVMQLLGLGVAGHATANKRRVRYDILFAEQGPNRGLDRQEVWFRPYW